MSESEAFLSLTREQIQGTVSDNMPFNTAVIDTLTDEQLENYFTGKMQIMNLPVSTLPQGAEPIIAGNLAGLKQRTLQGLIADVEFALSQGRTVPTEVITLINQA